MFVRPAEGRINSLRMTHKVEASHFPSGLSIMSAVIPPAMFVGPHTHSNEDECSYVLAGELTVEVGAETSVATAGTFVMKPRGVRHAFWNAGRVPAQLLEIHVPGTLETFYEAFGRIRADSTLEPEARSTALAATQRRYGIEPDWEHEVELAKRHNLG
jgi:quercetin dioxygenase-like cupin family protein